MRYQKIDMHIGPVLVPTKLIARDICGCGYELVKHDVPVGKTYQVDLKSVRWAKLRCGGCGKEQAIRLIDVWDEFLLVPQWYALDLLEIGTGIPFVPMPPRWEKVKNNMVAPKMRRPTVS